MPVDLKGCFSDPALAVMTFLNEVVQRYPQAISFAPGRPSEHLFGVGEALSGIERWVEHAAGESGRPPEKVLASLGQYGKTAGIIQEPLARHLALDAGIRVDPEAIVVTSGCQEAMAIVLLGLFEPATDTLLVSDPTYIGITGMARVAGIPLLPVPSGEEGLKPAALEEAIGAVLASGRRPRALYDIPDFNNPLGTSMPLATRHELLAVARRHGVLVLEDNPYGTFAYDGDPLPTLKSLDEGGSVLYLGSFAKTLFPGLRIGYLVADQEVAGGGGLLASALATVKSLTTVNTPPLLQAVVGAALLEHGGSLAPVVAAKLPFYRANRDHMLACLTARLGGVPGVSWNRPGGGFFITLTLPFGFGQEELDRCARQWGVIACPMSFFALSPGRERQVRLSFSYVAAGEIDQGIDRLAAFVVAETGRSRAAQGAAAGRAPAGPPAAAPTAPAEALTLLVERALKRRGLPEEHAVLAARDLVETSLRGIDTHGLRLLPAYLEELAGGRAKAVPQIRWDAGSPAARRMDAGGALGLVAGRIAAAEAARLARRYGVGTVAVCNSNHFGAASIYAMAIARQGLVGLAGSNADALVAPFGGVRPALGTNPLSLAAAGEDGELFCADFATSQAAYGRVKEYRERGWPLPPGWAVAVGGADASAAPAVAALAALKPLGGHKGQCLAMMVEILTALVAGAPAGHELSHFFAAPWDEPRQVSHFFLALDPGAFGDAGGFRRRLSSLLAFVRQEPGAAGLAVTAPGDPEARAAARRRREGIPLGEPERACLAHLAQEDPEVAPRLGPALALPRPGPPAVSIPPPPAPANAVAGSGGSLP
jgi:(S)-3,5-dihydroxyphenylglycine transaminase